MYYSTDTFDKRNETELITEPNENCPPNAYERPLPNEIETASCADRYHNFKNYPNTTKVKEKNGVFDELENIVQSLGNSYVKNYQEGGSFNDAASEAYNERRRSTNYLSGNERNDYHSLLKKCEYLESANRGLKSENTKLKLQLEKEQVSNKSSRSKLRGSCENLSKSPRNHISQIKSDFQNLLEETTKEHQRRVESIRKDFANKESELREKLRLVESTLRNDAEPKIHHLQKEVSGLLSDLHTASAQVETLKTENLCLKQSLEETERSSEEIIDVKDAQIKQLQDCNYRLSITVEGYESKERESIESLKSEHSRLQVEFERMYSQLEAKAHEDSMKLQECCEELERANNFNQELLTTLEEKNVEIGQFQYNLSNLQNIYDLYEKEKKNKENYKKKSKRYKSDLNKINNEKKKIKLLLRSNLYFLKMESLQREVETMKNRQNEKSFNYKKIKHDYGKLRDKTRKEESALSKFFKRFENDLAFARNSILSFERDLSNIRSYNEDNLENKIDEYVNNSISYVQNMKTFITQVENTVMNIK